MPSHEPFKFLPRDIFELSSRRHLIAGSGLPVALHRNVTFAFSRTITSLEVVESSMFGGTAWEVREKETKVVKWTICLVIKCSLPKRRKDLIKGIATDKSSALIGQEIYESLLVIGLDV